MCVPLARCAARRSIGAFVSSERIPIGHLYVLRKGMCVRLWRFLMPNSVWGEDMLLDDLDLVCHSQAVSLTYVEAVALSKPSFDEAAACFPGPMAKVTRKLRKIRIQRLLLRYMSIKTGQPDGTRSFICREHASGYSYVSSMPSHDKATGGDAALQHQLAALKSGHERLAARVEVSHRAVELQMEEMTKALVAIQGALVAGAPGHAQAGQMLVRNADTAGGGSIRGGGDVVVDAYRA